MKKKILGLSLAILFFGSISAPTFAMADTHANVITIVDNNKDNDKTKAKAKKSNAKECAAKSECCSHKKAECCDGEKAKNCDAEKKGDKK
jgi:hypothetical protein